MRPRITPWFPVLALVAAPASFAKGAPWEPWFCERLLAVARRHATGSVVLDHLRPGGQQLLMANNKGNFASSDLTGATC
jgi:hypothetical protein